MPCFSPDGTCLASGGSDGTMNLWDIATSRELLRNTGTRLVTSVCFSPDGSHLAWSSTGEAVRIRDRDGNVTVLSLDEKLSTESLAFAASGRYLAAGGGVLGKRPGQRNETFLHGHVHVWEIPTGRELLAVTQDRMPVGSVRFGPDAGWLAALSPRGGTRWDLASGTSLKFFTFPRQRSLRSLTVRSNGTPVVVGLEEESIRVWNLVDGEQLFALAGQASFLDFGPNGEVLGCDGTTAKVWDGSTKSMPWKPTLMSAACSTVMSAAWPSATKVINLRPAMSMGKSRSGRCSRASGTRH